MSDDKPIDAAAVEAAINSAIRRSVTSIMAAWARGVRLLMWFIEPLAISIGFFILAGSLAHDWFAEAPVHFLATLSAAGLAASLIHRSVDWPTLTLTARAKKIAAFSYLEAKAIAPVASLTAPVRRHKATKWTVAVLVFIATRVGVCLRWLGFLALLLLKAVGKLMAAFFEGFGHLLRGAGLFLGGLLIFVIWVFVLLGVIGILIFGIGQIF